MKRKLHVLNLALLALLALAGWRIWQIREKARLLGATVLSQPVQTAPPVVEPALKPPDPTSAVTYFDVAEHLVFSRDRNPVVEVAVIEKPVPPLPKAHGVLDLGTGPTAILSENSSNVQKAYRVGDKIGEFELVSASPTALEFKWEDKRIRKTIEELKPAETAAPEPQAAAAQTPQPAETQTKVVAASPAAKATPSEVEMGTGIRACQQDDTSPAGTVAGGYRKILSETPFGKTCRWEQIK